jgi:hypothetical protein
VAVTVIAAVLPEVPVTRPMTRLTIAAALAGAILPFAGTAASADAPPSEKIFPREQTWSCGDLGIFTTAYFPAGKNPSVLWLSPDGGRGEAIQVTPISGEITLTFGDESFTYVSREPAPVRAGQAQYRCDISGGDPASGESISGWTIVAVVGRAPHAA